MNKKIIAAAIAVTAIAGGYGAKEYALSSYNKALLNTPVVTAVESGFAYKNGDLYIESIVTDHAGFEWQSISKINFANEGVGLQLTTKAFAIDEKTAAQYSDWISATNKSLNAIGDSSVTMSGFHSDVRFRPLAVNTPSGTITLPETAVIYDNYRTDNKTTIVVAALGNVDVEAVGNKTTFKQPRIKYQPTPDSKQVRYSAKFDGVDVGLLEVSKATDLEVVIQPLENDLFNLGVDTKIEQLSGINNINSRLLLSNLTEASLGQLFDASFTSFSSDLASKVKNLTALFNYAKDGGTAKLTLTGEDAKGVPLNIDAALGFNENFRDTITTQNAFSILDSAEFDAKVQLPVELATSIAGPQWVSAFIRDGMIKLSGEQISTDISVRNMDAMINGNRFSL